MKRILAVLAMLLSCSTFAATLTPIQLLNPAGSTSGQAIVSTGPSTAPTWGNITATGLVAQASNTVVANVTAASASPTAVALPSCSAGNSALKYTSATGFSCGTTYALTSGTLAQFAATTSAQLLGIISDETGSGSLVFGTSPTLGSPAITGGTINNAAIGATTAAAGSFTTLNTSATAKLFATNISGQSIPSTTATVVTGWTAGFDQLGNFNAAAGTFTAPSTAPSNAYYLVAVQICYAGAMTSGAITQVQIFSNGSAVAIGIVLTPNAANATNCASATAVAKLTPGQTVQIKALQTNAGAFSLATTAGITYLSIAQIP